VNLEVRANFLSVRVVDKCNDIPDKITMSKNPGYFKRLYRADRCSSLEGAVR
jgi:hypothetical protein